METRETQRYIGIMTADRTTRKVWLNGSVKLAAWYILAEIGLCEVYVLSKGYSTEYHALYGKEWTDMSDDERAATEVLRESTVAEETDNRLVSGVHYCLTDYMHGEPEACAWIKSLEEDELIDLVRALSFGA